MGHLLLFLKKKMDRKIPIIKILMPNNINLLLIDVSILITLNLTNNPEMVAAKMQKTVA
ncbi:TPA: hypothetical protein ACXIOD_001586 [Neisseria meningitidis]